MNHIPYTDDLCGSTKLPLAMVIQPFADPGPYQNAVPIVDLGTGGPIRCNRCSAYVNPHVIFVKGGKGYICNICSMENEGKMSMMKFAVLFCSS